MEIMNYNYCFILYRAHKYYPKIYLYKNTFKTMPIFNLLDNYSDLFLLL